MADQQPDDQLKGPEKQAAPPKKETAEKTQEQRNREIVIAVYEKLQGNTNPEKIMGEMAKAELVGEKKQPSLKDWLVQGSETRKQINALSAIEKPTDADKQKLDELNAQEKGINMIEGHANSRVVVDILGPQLQIQPNTVPGKNFDNFRRNLNQYGQAVINSNPDSQKMLRSLLEMQYNGINLGRDRNIPFDIFLQKFETQMDLPIEPDDELVQRVTALESVLPKAAEPAPAEPATAEAAPSVDTKEQRIEKLTDEAMNTIQKMIIRVQGIEREKVKGIIESKLKTIETFLQESATRQIGMISRDTLGEITPNYAANSDIGRQIVIASAATATVINTIYAEDTTFNKFQNIGYQDLQQRMNDAQVLLTKDRIPNTTMSTRIFDVPPELTAEHNLPPEKKPIMVVQEFKRKDGSNVKAYYLTTRSILESDARISPVASPAATAEAPAAKPAETVKTAEKAKPIEGNVVVAPLARIIPDVHGGQDINTFTNPDQQKKVESPLADMLTGMQEGEVAVFVGDLFDRGGQSWRAAQEAMEMTMQGKAIYNFGNHEALFMGAMVTDSSGKNGDFEAFKTWIFNGGDEMAESAGVDMTEYNAAIDKFAKVSGMPRDAAKQVLLQSRDPALFNLHTQIKQNENLKGLHNFLTQHGKMFTIIDNVLVTHAGVLADPTTGALLDVNINGVNFGKGLEAFQKMEQVLKGADEEEKSKLILWLANHGGTDRMNAENPLWVRERNFQEVVQTPVTAHEVRKNLNEQAEAMNTKIELVVVGHTPSMGDKKAETTPLDKNDHTPRFLFADKGYYEGEEPRALLLRISDQTSDKVSAIYENPITGIRVKENSGANILERQYELTRGNAPEIGGTPKKAEPVVEDESKEILKEPVSIFATYGARSEGGASENPAALVVDTELISSENSKFEDIEIENRKHIMEGLQMLKAEGKLGNLAILSDNYGHFGNTIDELATMIISNDIAKAANNGTEINAEFLQKVVIGADSQIKVIANELSTKHKQDVRINSDLMVAYTDVKGHTFIVSVGQTRAYKLDTEGNVHLVVRESPRAAAKDTSHTLGGTNFTENDIQIVSGDKADLKPGEKLIIVSEGLLNRKVPDEIKEAIAKKHAYAEGATAEEIQAAKDSAEEELFKTVFLGGATSVSGEETLKTLLEPADKEKVYPNPTAAIVIENTTPPPITPEIISDENIDLEPGPVPNEVQEEIPTTGNPETDALIKKLIQENKEYARDKEKLMQEVQRLTKELEQAKAAMLELVKGSNISKDQQKKLKENFGIDLKDAKSWLEKPLPLLITALVTIGLLAATVSVGTGVLAHK